MNGKNKNVYENCIFLLEADQINSAKVKIERIPINYGKGMGPTKNKIHWLQSTFKQVERCFKATPLVSCFNVKKRIEKSYLSRLFFDKKNRKIKEFERLKFIKSELNYKALLRQIEGTTKKFE